MAETAKQKRDRIAKQAAAAADQFTRDTAALLGLNGSGGSSGGTGLSSAPIRFTGMGTADLLKTIKAGGVKGIIASQMYDALLPVLEASNTTGTSFKQRLSAAFGGGAGALDMTQLDKLAYMMAASGYGSYIPQTDKKGKPTPGYIGKVESAFSSFMGKYVKDTSNTPGMTVLDWLANSPQIRANGVLDYASIAGGGGTGTVKRYLIPPVQEGGLAGASNPTPSSVASSYDNLVNGLENWGFSKQQIASLGPRAFAAINGGLTSKGGVNSWLRQQPEYAQEFSGNIERMKKGLPPLAENLYTSYVQQMQEYGRAAGLPQGFLTNAEIGTLIANEVKPAEFAQRLADGYTAVMKADPSVLKNLQAFGVQPGQLAAFALDAKKAEPLISQQVNAAKLMSAAQDAGFQQQLKADQAMKFAQFAEAPGQSMSGVAQGIQQAGTMKGLMGTAPGQARQGLTQDQLLQGAVGTSTAAQQTLAGAQQAQAAPLKAGGGDVINQKGVVGAGYAATE